MQIKSEGRQRGRTRCAHTEFYFYLFIFFWLSGGALASCTEVSSGEDVLQHTYYAID